MSSSRQAHRTTDDNGDRGGHHGKVTQILDEVSILLCE
jgi:hypothetical protein